MDVWRVCFLAVADSGCFGLSVVQIERIMLFSQELSGLKLVDGGERQSWEEVDSWGKHVLGKKGVEACLNILHEKIVGRRWGFHASLPKVLALFFCFSYCFFLIWCFAHYS